MRYDIYIYIYVIRRLKFKVLRVIKYAHEKNHLTNIKQVISFNIILLWVISDFKFGNGYLRKYKFCNFFSSLLLFKKIS